MSVMNEIQTDYAGFLANQKDRARREFQTYLDTYPPDYEPASSAISDRYRAQVDGKRAEMEAEIAMWDAHHRAARRGNFLVRAQDAANPSFSMNEIVRRFRQMAMEAGLVEHGE